MARGLLVGTLVAAAAIAGCGSSSSPSRSGPGTTAPAGESTGSAAAAPAPGSRSDRRHAAGRAGRKGNSSNAGSACPPAQDVLAGVYDPQRLTVLDGCQRVGGTVESVRAEQDGDVHYDIAADPAYGRLLSAGNFSEQHGWLVVELMPRDGGHLPEPAVGDRVALVGALVDDSDHSWHEIHPVFSESINGGPAHTSGPQYGGSAPSDRSVDAAADCRTARGARCAGYAAPPSPESPASSLTPSGGDGGKTASCTASASYNPSYGDYDVYVHSNQPDRAVSVTDTAGDAHSWHTDSSGYADVYLRVSGSAAG